jgi:NADH dehydrogenase FAD-containing subunit
MSRPTVTPRTRVAIVGANFAGLTAAQQLDRRHAVTVFDPSPWFEWLPNIHELLSGVKRPADLRLPRRRLVEQAGHRFVRHAVAGLDARRGRLETVDGRSHDFDVAIVAVGGAHETFGVPGASRNVLPFDSVDDCAAIGRRLATLGRRRAAGSVVIVGGGFEGVEALGEILRAYGNRGRIHVTVVESAPRLLAAQPAGIDRRVRTHCAGREVTILTGTRVTRVTPGRVYLARGRSLRSDLTIWTAGSSASPLLHAAGLARRPGAWAPVTQALQSRRHSNVFVIGDAAELPKPLQKQAYYAMQMGECAAGNVERLVAGRPLRHFRPFAKGMLVTFGDVDTFLVAGRSVVASPALAAAKEGVYQLTMAQIDPPIAGGSLRDTTRRLYDGASRLVLPTLRSAEARRALVRLAYFGDGRE